MSVDVTSEQLELAVQTSNARLISLRKELDDLYHVRAEYATLRDTLSTLPQKVRHKAMVPLGPHAFFEATLEHTNEITVLLGANHYAEVSASQSLDILDRRVERIEKRVHDCHKEIFAIGSKRGFTDNLFGQKQTQITGDDSSITSIQSASVHPTIRQTQIQEQKVSQPPNPPPHTQPLDSKSSQGSKPPILHPGIQVLEDDQALNPTTQSSETKSSIKLPSYFAATIAQDGKSKAEAIVNGKSVASSSEPGSGHVQLLTRGKNEEGDDIVEIIEHYEPGEYDDDLDDAFVIQDRSPIDGPASENQMYDFPEAAEPDFSELVREELALMEKEDEEREKHAPKPEINVQRRRLAIQNADDGDDDEEDSDDNDDAASHSVTQHGSYTGYRRPLEEIQADERAEQELIVSLQTQAISRARARVQARWSSQQSTSGDGMDLQQTQAHSSDRLPIAMQSWPSTSVQKTSLAGDEEEEEEEATEPQCQRGDGRKENITQAQREKDQDGVEELEPPTVYDKTDTIAESSQAISRQRNDTKKAKEHSSAPENDSLTSFDTFEDFWNRLDALAGDEDDDGDRSDQAPDAVPASEKDSVTAYSNQSLHQSEPSSPSKAYAPEQTEEDASKDPECGAKSASGDINWTEIMRHQGARLFGYVHRQWTEEDLDRAYEEDEEEDGEAYEYAYGEGFYPMEGFVGPDGAAPEPEHTWNEADLGQRSEPSRLSQAVEHSESKVSNDHDEKAVPLEQPSQAPARSGPALNEVVAVRDKSKLKSVPRTQAFDPATAPAITAPSPTTPFVVQAQNEPQIPPGMSRFKAMRLGLIPKE